MNNKNDLARIIHTYQRYDPVNSPAHRAAAGPGVAGLRAPALLRQHAPADRGGTGQRRPHRPVADRGPRAEPRGARGDAPRAQAQDPRDLRDRPRTGAARQAVPRRGRQSPAAGEARRAVPARPSRRSSSATWRTSGTPSATTATRSPGRWSADRDARREVPGRRAGRQVRVHRPRDDGRARRRWRSRRSWRRSTSCSSRLEEAKKTAQIGIIDMEELAEVRRAGRHGAARRHCSSRSRTTSASRPSGRGSSGDGSGKFRLTPKAYPAVPVEAADDRSSARCRRRAPAGTRTGRRRGGGRDAADEALRVRRLGRAHGHPRRRMVNAMLRAGPRAAGAA